MKLKPSELVIITRMETYPLPPEGDNASLIRWRSFSPFWWAVMQGLLEGLLQPILWEEWSDNLRDEIVKHFIPNEPECPPIPPPVPPPVPPPPVVLPGTVITGSLGLTIDELEDFIMSFSLRSQLAWVNGVLCYWSDGCCEWTPIPIASGINPPSAIQKPDTGWTIDKWVEANRPPVPPILPIAPPPPELHITAESILCAKISGIFSALHDLLEDLRQVLLVLPATGTASLEVVAAAIAATFLTAGTGLVLVLAVSIIGAIVGIGAAVLADEINDYLVDWETYLPLWICWSVGAGIHDAGTNVTTNDLEMALLTLFGSVEDTPTASNSLQKLLRNVPLSLWDMEAQQAASTTPCGCSDYLPANYTPPYAEGAINFVRFVYNGGTSTVNPAGLPFEVLQEEPRQGSVVAGGYATQYAGIVTGSGNRVYHRCGMLFYCPTPVRIQEIRLTATPIDAVGSANFDMGVRVFDETIGWSGATPAAASDVPVEMVATIDLTGQWIYIALKVDDLAAPNIRATATNILFTGEIESVGFYQKGVGESLT